MGNIRAINGGAIVRVFNMLQTLVKRVVSVFNINLREKSQWISFGV